MAAPLKADRLDALRQSASLAQTRERDDKLAGVMAAEYAADVFDLIHEIDRLKLALQPAADDPEVAALAECMRALVTIPADARKRVIEYVSARFDEDE